MSASSSQAIEAKPFIKWVGGKRWALTRLLSTLPSEDDRFHYRAPFVGGGALFFALASTGRLTGASLSDANPVLISLHRHVRDRLDDLAARIQRHALNHGRAGRLYWKGARARFNTLKRQDPLSLDCAALLYYLQAVSFNGLYRENRLGEYNAPLNRHRGADDIFSPARLAVLQAASLALQGVELRICDFAEALAEARTGDRVFADPPYDIDDGALGHVGYVARGFGPADQVRLVDALDGARRRGVRVMTSNGDTPRIRALYRGWHLQQLWRSNTVGGRNSGQVAELLLTSWRPASLEVDGV